MQTINYPYLQQLKSQFDSHVIPFQQSKLLLKNSGIVIYSDASQKQNQAGFAFVLEIKDGEKQVLFKYQSKHIKWEGNVHALQLASALLAVTIADQFKPLSISLWVDNAFAYNTLLNSGFIGNNTYQKKCQKYTNAQQTIDLSSIKTNNIHIFKQNKVDKKASNNSFAMADSLSRQARQQKRQTDQWLYQQVKNKKDQH